MGQAIQELIELAQKRKGSPELQFKPMDQESYQKVARVDPPDGLLSQVPPRVDPDPMAGMPSPLRSQEETKGNKPK